MSYLTRGQWCDDLCVGEQDLLLLHLAVPLPTVIATSDNGSQGIPMFKSISLSTGIMPITNILLTDCKSGSREIDGGSLASSYADSTCHFPTLSRGQASFITLLHRHQWNNQHLWFVRLNLHVTSQLPQCSVPASTVIYAVRLCASVLYTAQ